MFENELDLVFKNLRKRKKKALIAYLAAGYPRFPEERGLIRGMAESGVDIFELGVPFSDPIADGPTIQFASQAALANGTTLKKVLGWTRTLRSDITAPLVFMSYINPILSYGVPAFARDARKAGVSGLIVPDLIPEESEMLRRFLNANGIHLIHMVAPTTPRDRQRQIAKLTGGFLYAVSVTGVTGARRKLPVETRSWLTSLRRFCPRPVCVGFGISGPEQIRRLKSGADGFIVGSALIDLIRKNKPKNRPSAMRRFVRGLSKECSHGG